MIDTEVQCLPFAFSSFYFAAYGAATILCAFHSFVLCWRKPVSMRDICVEHSVHFLVQQASCDILRPAFSCMLCIRPCDHLPSSYADKSLLVASDRRICYTSFEPFWPPTRSSWSGPDLSNELGPGSLFYTLFTGMQQRTQA